MEHDSGVIDDAKNRTTYICATEAEINHSAYFVDTRLFACAGTAV